MVGLRIAVGALGVGEQLPPADDDLEVVELHPGRFVDQRSDHVEDLVATARVGEPPPDLGQVGHRHPGVEEQLACGRLTWRLVGRAQPALPGFVLLDEPLELEVSFDGDDAFDDEVSPEEELPEESELPADESLELAAEPAGRDDEPLRLSVL